MSCCHHLCSGSQAVHLAADVALVQCVPIAQLAHGPELPPPLLALPPAAGCTGPLEQPLVPLSLSPVLVWPWLATSLQPAPPPAFP